ncbi:MAG: sigma-70 family RNA polymerase sigma factor [Planctomycetota bacterium]
MAGQSTSEFAALLERVRGGDRAALGALLEQHLPGLRAFVHREVGDALRQRVSESDLVVSACREALGELDGVRTGEPAAFRSWLHRIALRKVLAQADRWSAQSRDPRREVAADGDPVTAIDPARRTPSRELSSREETARIEAAIERLPNTWREVLVLARFEGLSSAAIAARLGKTDAAVRQALARARARLALELDEPTP